MPLRRQRAWHHAERLHALKARTRFITYSGASGDSVQPAGPWAASAWSCARSFGGRSSIAARTCVRSSAQAARSQALTSSACSSRCRSRASARSRRQTHTTSRHLWGSSTTPMTSVVPHIWHSPRSIVPRRSAIASFARAESAARVASSRRTDSSRRRVASC